MKVNLIKCLTFGALKICSDNRIKSEFEQIKNLFLDNGYLEDVIVDTMKKTVDKFRNNIVLFGTPKCAVNVRLLWIGFLSQLIGDKVFSLLHAVSMQLWFESLFKNQATFRPIHQDVLTIFWLINLIYKFRCCCNATYIGRTSQRLEVRAKQHVSREIHYRAIFGQSKLLDSAICEHLNAINNCVIDYNDEYFDVLYRARTKQHLVFLEVLYILFYKPTLCKQNPKHSLNLIGDHFLPRGGFN